jgi:photoactive yellow protein
MPYSELVEDVDLRRLDTLPFGVIVLDRDGTILAYNLAESKLSRLRREATIGKNFFRDVAPCASVRAFAGRFARFVADDHHLGRRFHFRFRFAWRTVDVRIQFVRLPDDRGFAVIVDEADAP